MGEKENQHMGTKFLGLFFGMIISIIYTIIQFFNPLFDPIADIPVILFVWAVFIFVIPLLVFLAEIMWRYAHKYSEKFPMVLTIPIKFWKLTYLNLPYTPLHR